MTDARRSLRSWVLGRPKGVRHTLWAQLTGRFDPAAELAAARAARGEPPARSAGGGLALLPVSALVDGEAAEAMIDGRPVAVCARGDGVVVFDGTCPHAGGPLGEGTIEDGALVCPYHGWRFRLTDGGCETASVPALDRWDAWIDDGWVRVTHPG